MDQKLCGIITDRDIVVRAIAAGEDPQQCTAEEILSEQLHTIHPEAELEDAADLMARHQIRRLPVVEEETVIGMISLGDIAVKSEEEEAGEVLEDVSEGVRRSGSAQRSRQGSGRGQSPGERVAEEEAEYQTQSRANRQESSRGRQKIAPVRAEGRGAARASKSKRKAS